MEGIGAMAVFMILTLLTGIIISITLIDGIVLHGALIVLSLMVTILITAMDFIITLISMVEDFGMDLGMDMPTITPTVDLLIASIITEGLMSFETAHTAHLIEVKRQSLGDLKSILGRFKEGTTPPLTLHLKTGTTDNQEQ